MLPFSSEQVGRARRCRCSHGGMGRNALTMERSHRSEAALSLSRWARRRSSPRSSSVGPDPNPNPHLHPHPHPNPNPNPDPNQVGRGPPSTATSSRRTFRAPRRASSPLARPRRTLRRWSTPASWPRASRKTWKRGGCCRGSNRESGRVCSFDVQSEAPYSNLLYTVQPGAAPSAHGCIRNANRKHECYRSNA